MITTDVLLAFEPRPRRQGESMTEMNVRKLKDGLDYLVSKAAPAVRCEVGEVDEAKLQAKVKLHGVVEADVADLVGGTGLTVLKMAESVEAPKRSPVVPVRRGRS